LPLSHLDVLSSVLVGVLRSSTSPAPLPGLCCDPLVELAVPCLSFSLPISGVESHGCLVLSIGVMDVLCSVSVSTGVHHRRNIGVLLMDVCAHLALTWWSCLQCSWMYGSGFEVQISSVSSSSLIWSTCYVSICPEPLCSWICIRSCGPVCSGPMCQ
jgi:hypothetical protein